MSVLQKIEETIISLCIMLAMILLILPWLTPYSKLARNILSFLNLY